ncbi:unnamed protein product [Ectocarpus fasciculatus]
MGFGDSEEDLNYLLSVHKMLDIHATPMVLLYCSGQLVDEFTCAGDSGPRVTPAKPGGERSVKGRSAAGEGTGDRAATKHRYRKSSPRNH